MENCKYVVIDTDDGGPAIFLFPPFVSHAVFARLLVRNHSEIREKVLSAGFVRATASGLRVYGESESLRKKSDPVRDNALLARLLPAGAP